MKKRSKMVMIGAFIAAVTLFTVTVIASTPNESGYDAFKQMLKANDTSGEQIQSAMIKGNFTVKADGESMLESDGTLKVGDEGNVSGDFDFTFMGVERNASVYSSDDNHVYVVDNTHDLHYQVTNLEEGHDNKHIERWDHDEFENRPMTRSEEALLDWVVGDLKDQFSVTNHADGSKTILLDVNEEEVPLPLRLLTDVASTIKKHERTHTVEVPAEWERLKQFPFFQGLDLADFVEQMPELTTDITIEHVRLQMTVTANNEWQGMQGKLAVRGKDEAGVTHRVEIEGVSDFSNINHTTPDVYDPAGHSVEIIDAATFNNHH